ncbi:DNA polymerase III subunit delta [Afipia sp. P52-10]|jgi:DNA polymerase-3 subunit delta|uniref:DNA polymerase III subunit delta n=1 Tax=Afipia sp. P52-10 TaxID=1429916 RepID=UPI0003DF0D2B|nr:DNA polymerase III subunit delta [Afipia sp. P52-10]ETR77796.1 DNA polymerase III subunit delta [Afipia sp. P52-10]
MVAINTREIETYVAKPSPAHAVILVFGADVGLVRERADALIASAVEDVNDPFSLVRLEGDDLAAEPSRLVDEAMTVPLFGGRRAIRVRAGSKNFSSGVAVLLEAPPPDCRIVIEAGELRRDSPLRAMCEKAKTAAVIACYADGVRDLSKLIDDELNTSGLRIAQDARAALVELLGGDRLASRNEIRKLVLYAHGKGEITLDDIAAVVTDASNLALDPIIDNTFAGQPAGVEAAFAKAIAAGINPNAIMFAAQRQASQLHKARMAIDEGQAADSAFERAIPRWHFARKPLVVRALNALSTERLAQSIVQLGEATLELRKRAALAETIAQRALMAIAVNARRRG